MENLFGYRDKICVVTGAGSGMGKATAELLAKMGAKVYAMDIREMQNPQFSDCIHADLSDSTSIDEAFSRVPDQIDRYFGIAGLRGATMPFMAVAKINLFAHKHILEDLLPDRFNPNGAAVVVSSAVGTNWFKEGNAKFYRDILSVDCFEDAEAMLETSGMTAVNGGFAYVYSKLALNYYVASMIGKLGKKGIRINALLPGDTATSFGCEDGQSNVDSGVLSPYTGYAGRYATPEEMAWPLLFLNSDLASYISGALLPADFGAGTEILAGLRNSPVGDTIAG